MKKLAKLLLVVMLVSAFALVLTACTKTDCELGKHDFTGTETVTKEATCTEKGSKTIKCKNCDETTTVEIDALGHDYAGAWTVVAGKHSQKCSRCDSTTTHDPDMGAWAVVEGKHVQTCSKCSVKGEHDANLSAWTVAEGKHVRSCTETGCTIKEEHNADMGKFAIVESKHVRTCSTTGCTIKDEHAPQYDATKHTCKASGCEIVDPAVEAKVGSTYYLTLADALKGAKDGNTIVLQKDIVVAAQINVSKSITIDFNGKTMSNTVDLWTKNAQGEVVTNSMMSIGGGAEVILTGNGKMDVKQNDAYAINVVDGKLTVQNGEYVGNITAIQLQKGLVTINGGKFSIKQHSSLSHAGPYDFMLNCIDQPYKDGIARIIVKGGQFVNFDPANNKAEGANTSFVATGYASTEATSGTDKIYTVAAHATHSYNATSHKCTCGVADPAHAVANIGNIGYLSVAEAVADALDGAEIVLQKDAVVNKQIVLTKTIVLDMNGHKISNTENIWNTDGENADYGFFALIKGGNLTVTGNGKMLAKANDGYVITLWDKDSKLVIENGEFTGNLHSIYVYAGTAEIKGGKYDLIQLDADKIAAGGNGHEFTLNLFDTNGKNGTAKIIVSGGSFVEYDPAHSDSEAPEANFVAGGLKTVFSTVEGKKVYSVTFDSKFETTDYDELVKDDNAVVVGYVKSINTNYPGSIVIADIEGNELTIYGVCDEHGKTISSGNISKNVSVGDMVVLYGAVSEYNENLQISNGWLIQIGDEAKTTLAAIEIENIAVPEEFIYADFDLAVREGLTWSVKQGSGIVVNGNKATVTRAATDSVVILLATLVIDGQTATKEMPVTVVATGTVKVIIDFTTRAAQGDGKTTVGYGDINAETAADGEFTLDGKTYLFGGSYKKDSYGYIMLAKNSQAYIANKTAMSGNILAVEVDITSGASAKTKYYIHLSTEATTSSETNSDNFVGKGQTFKKTATAADGYKYFSVTTGGDANNGQVARIVVTCVEAASV